MEIVWTVAFLPHDAMLMQYQPSSCVSPPIHLSITCWYCIKMAKYRIMQVMPCDS